MTDIFDAENITSFSSGFASTAPQTTPAPIPVAPVSTSKLTERANFTGSVPNQPDPRQIADRMSALPGDGAAVPVVAPPQAPANSGDIFDKEGIAQPAMGGSPFGNSVVIPSADSSTPQNDNTTAVSQYVQHQQQQNSELAAKRFTPEQLSTFVRNPQTWAEAIQNQQDWSDIPALLSKNANGVQLDQAQTSRLNEYVDNILANNMRGSSWNGDIATTGSQLPAQAVDYINQNSSGIKSADSTQPGQVGVTGNTVLPSPYAPKYGETPLNEFAAATDKGRQIVTDSATNPATAALKASAGISLDAANNPTQTGSPLITSIDQLSPHLKAALYDIYKETNPKAQMSDVMTQSGWSKMVDTIGESKAAQMVGNLKMLPQVMSAVQDAIGEAEYNTFSEGEYGLKDADLATMGITPADSSYYYAKGLTGFADAAVRVPLALINGGIAGVGQLLESLRIAGKQEVSDQLNDILTSEAGRAGEHAQMEAGAEAMAAELPKASFDEHLETLNPGNKDKTMVNNGLVSIDGSESHSTAGVIGALTDKGVAPEQAAEAASNMTATEKDNFINQNFPKPQGTFPRSAPEPQVVDASIAADKPLTEDLAAPQTVFYDGEVTRGQLDSAQAKEPPPLNDDESIFDLYYRAMHHDLAPAELPYKNAIKSGAKVDRLDNTPMMIALNHQIPSMVDYYVNEGTYKFDSEGHPIDTGKSLKATFDDFDNYFKSTEPDLQTRRDDFNKFLIARHYQSLLENAKDVTVTPEQIAQSAKDLGYIRDKYGDDEQFFHTFGNEFVSFRKRTRDLLVGTLLTKEARAIEDKRYPYSIPLKRELDKKQYESAVAKGDYTSLNPSELTKRLKGSSLPVKDIVTQTLRETARTIDFVQRNRVANSIYNLRKYAPDRVQVTARPSVLKGTATFEHAYDPKLRTKLQQMAESLGMKVTRGEEAVKGEKGALGAYDFNSGDIYLKHGTTEGTLTHEIGHGLDDKFGLEKRFLGDKDIKAELEKLSDDRLKAEIELQHTDKGKTKFVEDYENNPEKYGKYVKEPREVLANFFDAWVNSRKQVERIAPKAVEAFGKLIDENPKLEALRDLAPSTARASEKIKKEVYGRGDIPRNAFPFWKDGKEVLLQVSKPMYEALSSMRPSQLNAAERFFLKTVRIASGAKYLRTGATSTPEFAARNVVKDTLEASVQSGVGYNASYIPRSLYGVLMKDKGYREFTQSGGKFGHFMSLDEDGIEHSFEDILNPQSKLRKLLSNPADAFEYVPKVSEQITRYGVYNAAIARGMSPVEAAHYSLDATLQFPRGGFISKKWINPIVPFFNVGLLATEKLIRAFKEDPKTMILRGSTFLTSPALAIAGYYLYGSDDETRKAWLEIPIDRITSGQIPFGYDKTTGNWRYLPTPYALGYLFAGMPMLLMRQLQADAPDDGKAIWSHVMTGFMGSISPINDASAVIPPTVKVAIEDATNYDLYRGREIYSKFKEGAGVLQEDKTNPNDSETAKLIGKFFGASPAALDHTVYGLFGSSASYGLAASDALVNGYRKYVNGETIPEKPTNTAGGLLKPFTIRSPEGFRSNSYQQFQSNLLQATAIEAHLKTLEGTDEEDAYRTKNEKQLEALGDLKAANKDIQKQSKAISGIYNDPDEKADAKATDIREIEKQITERARDANSNYNDAMRGSTK